MGAYIPIVFIIKHYLTEYASVLNYVYAVLALCIPLGKFQMLITTYMKALRLEKQYFFANFCTIFPHYFLSVIYCNCRKDYVEGRVKT
jgi:hypothetical protein